MTSIGSHQVPSVSSPWQPSAALEVLPSSGYSGGDKIAYADKEELPKLSVVLQYFRMSRNIKLLLEWKRCPGVELLVNVDSDDPADRDWLPAPGSDHHSHNATRLVADTIVFSQNIHELRAYNRLARMARAPLLALVQDDNAPPVGCEYLQHLNTLFNDDPTLAIVGMNFGTTTPWAPGVGGYKDADAGAHSRFAKVKRDWRRATASDDWTSCIKAEYVSCTDIGPYVVRRDAFMRLGALDEGFSYPGQGGMGLDCELATRVWISGGSVALYDLRGSGGKRTGGLAFPTGKEGLRPKAYYFGKDNRVSSYQRAVFTTYRKHNHNISRAVLERNARLPFGAGSVACPWGPALARLRRRRRAFGGRRSSGWRST